MSRDDRTDDRGGPRTANGETRRRLDEFLSLVADRRRRDLLYQLTASDVTDVETLAENVAAVSEEVPPAEVSREVRDQIRLHLVHTHLPKLADAGAIEFDPRSEAIRLRELPPVLGRLVETCRDIEVEE